MADTNELLEKVVLGEIDGKNKAIHAYDGMVWRIRTGFLTLLFGGWAIVLKGFVETPGRLPSDYQWLALGLYLFSLGFTLGAWYVDRSYVRRKFRVILALNRLTDAIQTCGGDIHKIPLPLLQVAGDDAHMPFDSPGFREAIKAELAVYLAPVAILAAGITLIVR